MINNTRILASFLGLLVCMFSIIADAQGKVTAAVLGTGVTGQYEIVGPTNEFNPDTAKIYCVWKVEGAKSGATMRGLWIAVDVGKVAPPNYKIDEAIFTPPFGAPSNGSFALGKPNKGFPVGTYRLEIYIGKDLAKTLPFTVKAK